MSIKIEGKGWIYAKIIKDSISPQGIRLTTIETRAPKFIDAEIEKHRMLSSNSSSSRAINVDRIIQQVTDNPYVPFSWREEQKGMQGYEEVEEQLGCLTDWIEAAESAVYFANSLKSRSLHKQTINRLLEPFIFQKKLITATEWDNFFRLRLAKDAQPEIQELAKCMKEAMDKSTPQALEDTQWHLPYIINNTELSTTNLKVSVARCARISYGNDDSTSSISYDIERDIKLYNRLKENKHFTPFEHQAIPMIYSSCSAYTYTGILDWRKGITHIDREGRYWSGNFRGWIQYRQLINEWNS